MSQKTITKREHLKEIVGHRNRALELVERGFQLLIEADKEYRVASLEGKGIGIFAGLQHSDWFALESDSHFHHQRLQKLIEKCRKRIDQGTWEHIIGNTRINNLMDAEQACQLRAQLREEPPEVSTDTALVTLEELYLNRDKTFRKSVVNIFSNLCNNVTVLQTTTKKSGVVYF